MASKFKTPYELYLEVSQIPNLTYYQIIHIFALAKFISISDIIEPEYKFIIINRFTKPRPDNPNITMQLMDIHHVTITLGPCQRIHTTNWSIKTILEQ